MKEEILKKLQEIVKELTQEDIQIEISRSNDSSHGDWTTNVALRLGKILGKNPMEVAEEIVKKFSLTNDDVSFTNEKTENGQSSIITGQYLDKVQVASPGFINFYLSPEYLVEKLQEIIQNPDKIGKTQVLIGQKVSVEFTDPNPFKEFHIGHLYTNTVGESVSRILEANGATVWRADYFGDVGMHVAKALYGLKAKFAEDGIGLEDLEKRTLKERIEYFGQAYAKGSSLFDVEEHASKIKKLNKLIFIAAQRMWQKEKGLQTAVNYTQGEDIDEKELEEIYSLYVIGRQWSLDYFDSIYERLGMRFDGYYPESIAGERGYKLVKDHIGDGVFEESQGAVIFPGKKYGLHDRVFINSLGLPTYEAKELGLAPWKYGDFQYDQSIILTGSEIVEYFKVLIKAMTLINEDLGKKTMHIGHGMVRLPEGKMSSRTGNVLTGEWLIEEAEKKAYDLQFATGRGFPVDTDEVTKNKIQKAITPSKDGEENLKKITQQVAIGAIKYAFLKASIGKDIEFDLDTSLSLSGNSGPYIQYTHVRTKSILEKAGKKEGFWSSQNDKYSLNAEELDILRQLDKFSDVVEQAAVTYSPNVVANYLFELAQLFNNFYQMHRIADAATEEEKQFRLALTQAVGNVLKKGLELLGIVAPEKM